MRATSLLALAACSCIHAGVVSAAYREVPVEHGGTITGTVLVAGEVPVLPPQPVFKQLDYCAGVADDRLLVGNGGALANAVVDIEDVPAGKPIPRDTLVTLDNSHCAFVPHVRSATVGQSLEIHNSDPFVHDAHAWLGTRTLFNVGILPEHSNRQLLTEPGLVHINCNVRHTWMHAYVFVGENPYHAVTDANGRFAITQVPPGQYTVRVWHELLGNLDRPVTVEPGATATIDVAFPLQATVPTPQLP
jgi:plastocyanin